MRQISNKQQLNAEISAAGVILKAETLRRRLKANFDPNQPRVPRGNADGGRWTDAGGESAANAALSREGPADSATTQAGRRTRASKPLDTGNWQQSAGSRPGNGSTVSRIFTNRAGTRVVSQKLPAGGERNSVTPAGGQKIVFENIGRLQRIFDATGRLISKTRLVEGVPVVVRSFLDGRRPTKKPWATPTQVVIDAAIELYDLWLSKREPAEGTVFAFKAALIKPSAGENEPPILVANRPRDEIEQICKRLIAVQQIADKAASNHPRRNYESNSLRGTAIHLDMKNDIEGLNDPDFRAEVSVIKSQGLVNYGERGSVRIDAFERRSREVVCIYDLKTGYSGFSNARMVEMFYNAQKLFPSAQSFFMIEVRPNQ